MTHLTKNQNLLLHRVFQYVAVITVFAVVGGGYWYWREAQAGVTQKGANKNGLVGYWSFDEGTGTQAGDASGNGNTGTLTNGPTWVDGARSKAVNFDGTNDYATIGINKYNPILSGASGITVSAWVNPSAYPTGTARKRIFSVPINNSVVGVLLNIYSSSGLIEMGGRSSTSDAYKTASITYPSLNEWHLVTGILDFPNDKIYLYLDGELQVTQTVTFGSNSYTPGTPTTLHDTIGSLTTTGEYWKGKIDEVRVYERVLGSTEIADLYALGAAKLNTSQNSSLTDGLVGEWSFNGPDISGTTAYDRSGSANNGTLTNGPTATIGRSGQALDFDGTDDYITVANSSSLQFSGAVPITLSAWVNPAQNTAYGTFLVKGRVSTDAVANYAFRQDITGKKLDFYFNDAGSVNWQVWSSTNDVFTSTSTWYHVVVTYTFGSAGSIVAYVNGQPVAGSWTTGSGAVTADVDTQALVLGQKILPVSEPFSGKLDEVRVYNRALIEAEISDLYQLGNPDKINAPQNDQQTGGLVGLWSFNGPDISGTTAYDRSGSGNNGTLTNGPTVTIGKVGQGMSFDQSNDLVSIVNEPNFDFERTDTFSVSAWVKATNTTPASQTIVGKIDGPATYSGWEMALYNGLGLGENSNALYFQLVNNNTSSNMIGVSSASGTISAGKWYHLVATYTGNSNASGVTLYIDGISVPKTTHTNGLSASILTNTVPAIGGRTSTGDWPFGGRIDEVRIYNRALTAEEVTALYNAGR